MEEILKDVLIKEASGNDKVFIVDNLPKSFLYRKELKLMIDYTDVRQQQNLVPAFEVDERGRKIPTKEQVDTLLPGIELGINEENCFVFSTDYNEAKERLAAIDRYIEKVVPNADRIPERVSYAAQRGLMSSAPLARHLIPRVVLPELVSPPVLATAQAPAPRELSKPEKPANRRVWTEEQKEAARQRMANARAAKAK